MYCCTVMPTRVTSGENCCPKCSSASLFTRIQHRCGLCLGSLVTQGCAQAF